MTVDILDQYERGEFRHIVKTKLGMTCVDARDFDNVRMNKFPESIISGYKRGVLQTVQFKAEGSDTWLTVFSRTGKKVKLIDETILRNLTVGTINSMFDNTNLMDQNQYRAVNSKTWASMAFIMNENKVEERVAS
tara:strand:+ start:481 stop:885 length:405 start_codon:yes stop_codon:yes gene_type:complete